MTDWLKSIQSIARGLRKGEIHVSASGRNIGKSVLMDISESHESWREIMLPHYAELYRDPNTGETYWKKFNRLPPPVARYTANTVIRKNEDGTYEYIKNRSTGELGKVPEEEIIWIILKAGV